MKADIPVKPPEATWTDDQWKAIHAKGQDILVAAAAGSGKTAVLVERIIRKVMNEEEPVNVDELLVVTFTNASAAEMRNRIGEALEKAIDKRHSPHLRRQLGLLNKASISTLHSFCLDMIRKYYYKIDIDPGFRIADDTEAVLLREEVMDDLFEVEYGLENNEAFFKLVDTFSSDRNDADLQSLVLKLYDFSRSHPEPARWLDRLVQMYESAPGASVDDLPFAESLRLDIGLAISDARDWFEKALAITRRPGGPYPRAENMLEDLAVCDELEKAADEGWDQLYEAMNRMSFGRAKACRGDEFDKALTKQSDDARKKGKGILEKLAGELFSRRPESFLRDMAEMKGTFAALADLVKKFSDSYSSLKSEKGLVDFADLEHYCLEILTDSGCGSERQPSEAALACRQQFKEVMVDEYQDTNLVQETILKLVSNGDNMFMVGDVKQSIYRFRLAEPNLFLEKYNAFTTEGTTGGLKIDLSRNFRSRKEVLDGTNFVFKQIMGKKVGEIEYDEAAELVKGAGYPEDEPYPVELAVIDKAGETEDAGDSAEGGLNAGELEKSQLEARFMANKIKQIIEERKMVFDTKRGSARPVQYKDIVILMRSMSWTPVFMEEFKAAGIPLYANLSTGYFEATEISIMLSLLKIIDNPYQDIPLAAVLRSPITGLNEEELAHVRTHSREGSYYEASKSFIESKPSPKFEEAHERIAKLFEQLSVWRSMARQGALSDLIWQLYRDTGFYDFVGGLPGGKQRQANLRALYDRSRQYEETSFRGLFRFLRFIERMRERGKDLGEARILGEQEDVVRIMTIHSSKGLEFPVVFLAGLGRKFNMMDIYSPYLFDKDWGFACKFINPEKRISYPSLPQLAFKRKKKMETIAEEMRVLYVALTRAKEKLILVASVKDAGKEQMNWSNTDAEESWLLKDVQRARAMSYLDWIGPALSRHSDCFFEGKEEEQTETAQEVALHPSRWKVEFVPADDLLEESAGEESARNEELEIVKDRIPVKISSHMQDTVYRRLSWEYGYSDAVRRRSKQSVSEIKRLHESRDEASDTLVVNRQRKPVFQRPRFMEAKKLTPAERGTAMHAVMQNLPLAGRCDKEAVQEEIAAMVSREILTEEQAEAVSPSEISAFFDTEIGQKLLASPYSVQREVPFTMGIPASEIYQDWRDGDEALLVQGMIDCVLVESDGVILIDYKSDSIQHRYAGGFHEAEPILKERYNTQLHIYSQAIERIWKQPVKQKYLYFFDGGHLLEM